MMGSLKKAAGVVSMVMELPAGQLRAEQAAWGLRVELSTRLPILVQATVVATVKVALNSVYHKLAR
jgi:hypothetical protein